MPLSGPRFSQVAPSAQANEALDGNDNGNDEDEGDVRKAPFKTRLKPPVMSGNQKYRVREADDCANRSAMPNPIGGHAIGTNKSTLCRSHAGIAIRWQVARWLSKPSRSANAANVNKEVDIVTTAANRWPVLAYSATTTDTQSARPAHVSSTRTGS